MTEPAASSDSAEPAKPPKSPHRRRTWRQRFKILILIVLIGACIFRIALNWLLPTVIDRVAGVFGLDCGYQRLDLSLLGGKAHVWGLQLRPREGGDTLATCDYIEGDLSPLDLLRGRLVVYRAEVDGADVTVERAADGSIPLLQKFLAGQSKNAAPATPAATTQPQAMSLAAPLRVDAIRLSHLTAHLRDRSVTPNFEATVRTGVRVSNVGAEKGPAHFELEVGVEPLLDTLRVEGEAHTSKDALEADVQVLLRGLHPKTVAAYLAPLGLRPIADTVTAQANLSLSAKTIPGRADFSATVALDHVSAVADGQQWASLATLTLDAKRVGTSGAALGRLVVADGFASATHTASGTIRAAGMELVPVIAAPPTTQPATRPAAIAVTSAPPFYVSLDSVDVRRLQAVVTDEAVSSAAALVARLDAFGATGIDTDPAHAATPIPFSASATLPDVVQAVTVKGQVTPFAAEKTAALDVRGRGLRPDAWRPYLDRIGLRAHLTDGGFEANVAARTSTDAAGTVTATAEVTNARLTDGPTPLVELSSAKVDRVTFTPADGSVAVRAITVVGPTLTITRDPQGHLSAAGFTYAPPSAAPPLVPASTTKPATAPSTDAPPALAGLPRVEIGRLSWTGATLTLQDQLPPTPTSITLNDTGLAMEDLLIDLNAKHGGRPGKFNAWFNAPGVADQFNLYGTFDPQPGRFVVDAAGRGRGLNGGPLAPYLRPLGVVPVLNDGQVDAKASLTLTQASGRLGIDLNLTDVRYADGAQELLGVDALSVGGLSVGATRFDLDHVTLKRPRVRVAREVDGAFRAAGVRLVTPAPATQPTAITPTTRQATVPAPTPLRLVALPVELGLRSLKVDDAVFDWSDAMAATPVDVHAVVSASLDGLDVSPVAKPATLHVTAAINDALRRATVDGTVTPSPVAPAFDLKIVADGLAAGPLVGYLPPTLRPTLRDGHFETALAAGMANNDAGALSARLRVSDLALTSPTAAGPTTNPADDADAVAGTPLLRVGSFVLTASRIDPAASVFAIDDLSCSGVSVDVNRTESGEIETAGVRLVAAPPARPAMGPAPTTAPAAAPAPMASLAALVGDARRPLPEVSIGRLDLGVDRFALSGFTGPGAAPLALRNFRLIAAAPLAFGGRRPDREPLKLILKGAVERVVHGLDATLVASPMANEPAVAIDVAARGIRGDGLLAVLPALKASIDGSGLVEGTFTTHVDASVNYGRRGPRDFDLGRGFTAEFDVKPLEFRGTPDGPVLAGVAALHGEGIKVEPANGNVTIKSIDVNTPTGRVYRDDKGLHACGLTVPLGAREPVERLAPASQPSPAPAAAPPTPTAAAVVAARPANELRLDHFTITGIDAVIEDRTSTPPTVVPLKSLDVDVRGLSNQLPWSGKPVRFSALVTSDKVPLPPRKGISGVASTRPAVDGAYTEQRELFSQITAAGNVAFARNGDTVALDGWTKTAVNGFELLGVRGLAKQYGVTVGGGVFDDVNDVRFHADGPIETKTKLVLTNLSLSEAANGPLQRVLKLPTPIDVAIGAVTDPDGSITMNLPVPIKNGAVSTGDVVGPALGAVTNVLITGIASAPVKAIGGVGQLLGLGAKAAAPEAPVVIGFLPGYDGLDADGERTLGRLVERLVADDTLELQLRQTLTDADVARTATRATPPPDACAALATQVRRQKAELLRRHETLTAQARGDLGGDARARATATLAELREVDARLARAEESLDELYALTGRGAAAQTDRRTRTASLELARHRLEAVRAAVVRDGLPNVAARVSQTNPQFDPTPDADGGLVTITLVTKKH